MTLTIWPLCIVAETGDFLTAHYTGSLESDRVERFLGKHHPRSIRVLEITSDGGEVEAAILLGSWIFENQIDVSVTDYCLSSCANYVFSAGRKKIIQPGAIVAWHGNYRHLKLTGS